MLRVVLHSMLWLPITANIVHSLPIFVTLMMKALHSSETSALTRVTWQNIVFLRSMLQMIVTEMVPSSPILVTLVMEVLHSSETLVLTTATWHNIPEDGILHSHCHRNLKSYLIPNTLHYIKILAHTLRVTAVQLNEKCMRTASFLFRVVTSQGDNK
jgi:hypothetical protein